ncbi:hypothetical protein HMPREF1505_1202 [Prevotella sp. ICM33]|nr:hypothetical protein HMPREF0659_A7288 [Prevotella melaninogenica ATCC 25845]ETT01404.1 hypothetical protein HMPREF1505_1202 [Prevotella sp. ICM33]
MNYVIKMDCCQLLLQRAFIRLKNISIYYLWKIFIFYKLSVRKTEYSFDQSKKTE